MTQAATGQQGRRYSIAQLAMVAPLVALIIGAWGEITDNSFLWHVRAGSLQLDTGKVLTADPFSFTLGGERWLTQSWLAELLYGWLERWSGLSFVPWMILLVGGTTMLCIGVIAYLKSGSATSSAFVLVLSTLAIISFLVPRPVLFSYLLMTTVVLAWERPSTRWTLPFLFWVWAAVHGSFAIGLIYVVLRIFTTREWHQLWLAVAAGIPTLFTAHGLGVAEFLLDFGDNRDALQYITEWRRPELFEPVFLPLLGGLVFIAIGVYRKVVPLRLLVVAVPFAVLGATSVRAIPPAWIGLIVVVSVSLRGMTIGSQSGLRSRLAVVFFATVLILPFLLAKPAELSDERFPVEAVLALTDGNVFHDDISGGYLIWRDGPSRQVYIDDRAELYGERLGEFVGVRKGTIAYAPVFERDEIDQVLLPLDAGLVEILIADGWTTSYEDENFVVLTS